MPKDEYEIPDRNGESGQAGLDQQLQIVIVRLVDEEGGVETAKLRIDNWKRAESPTQQRPLEQHMPAVAVDGNANSTADFFTSFAVNAHEALSERVAADPNQKNNDNGHE